MGIHRRRRVRRRHQRAGILAGATMLVGVAVLVIAAMRADLTPTPGLAAAPAPVAAASPATPPTFTGTWVGSLADPDTSAVDVRLTVDDPGHGVVLEVPALRCTYRGGAPAPGPVAVADVRPVRTGSRADDACADSARIRLAASTPEGPATDRVRYELLETCDAGVCTPRRASGVLTAWRPGP